MNLAPVETIVRAVLYEGYILYPYRPSSVKNRQRWTFGGIYPRDYAANDESSASRMQTECLIRGNAETQVEVHVRFLHLLGREVGKLTHATRELPKDREPDFTRVASLEAGGSKFHAWDEAVERDIAISGKTIAELTAASLRIPFGFPGSRELEPLRGADGSIVGVLIRTSASIEGEITVAAVPVSEDAYRLTVGIDNVTPFDTAERDPREAAQRCAFTSTHTILGVVGGVFVSQLDPPDDLADIAAACDNRGTWPVLAGDERARDTMLSSPIILYDYPQVAPESPGDLFDATEIDEILILRILTMTDEEKREMIEADPRARTLLERTEALTAADMERLHGTMRDPRFGASFDGGTDSAPQRHGHKPELAFLHVGGSDLKVGDRVRLQPKARADIMDIVLKDEVAVIEAIERDFEDRVHVAVVLEADPGREFGLERMPGHRFFFAPEELEPVLEDGPG